MQLRAELQFRAGRRGKPLSLTTEGLSKFASQLSLARRVSGFWGKFEEDDPVPRNVD